MIRIAIVDDERHWIDSINECIVRYSRKYEIDIFVEKYLSCEELLTQYLKGGKFDIVFLDIEFKSEGPDIMNGIDFGKRFRDIYKDDNTAIVFVTSYKEYAFDAIKIRPFGYLEKPITYEKICEVIDQCRDSFDRGKKIFRFVSEKTTNGIVVSNIRYFESFGHKIRVHTVHNTYEFYGKLSDIMRQECLEDFIQIHKSILVNTNYIERFTSNSVILFGTENIELPISKNKKSEVSEKLLRR